MRTQGDTMTEIGPPGGQRSMANAATSWGYQSHNGPALWGTLDRAFRACALGTEQSPIDLTGGRRAELAPVEFDYGRSRIEVENTGHTIQINPEPGHGIVLDGTRHELSQFHFHRASEHLVDGVPYPMELHLVHRDGGGGLAVVGVLICEGEENAALAPAWACLPPDPGESRAISGEIDLAALLPPFGTTWRYRGSLTTPPCTEGVAWIVPDEPLPMSPAQIAAFAAIYPNNRRPVQPLGDRDLWRG